MDNSINNAIIPQHLHNPNYVREMRLSNLHRLWLGRGTHCHHLVCNFKEESKSQFNFRKIKIPNFLSYVGHKEALKAHYAAPNVPETHGALQWPWGHQNSQLTGPIQYTQAARKLDSQDDLWGPNTTPLGFVMAKST